MKIKDTIQYLHTSGTMATIKLTVGVEKDMEKLEPSCIVAGNVKWQRHIEEQFNNFTIKLNMDSMPARPHIDFFIGKKN